MRGSVFLLILTMIIFVILIVSTSSRPNITDSHSIIFATSPVAQFSSMDRPIIVPLDHSTIQEAINAAYPGATIEVYSGVYHENLRINKRLALKGVDSGAGSPIIDAGRGIGGLVLQSNGVILENFRITNTGIGSALDVSSSCNLIKNNTISNNSMSGIRFNQKATGNIVFGNNITYNGFSGIVIADGAYDNSIVENNISYNGFSGVNLKEAVADNLLLHNRILFNGFNGVLLMDDASSNMIVGNIIYNNTFGGIDLKENTSRNMITENRIMNNTFTGLSIMDNSSGNIIFFNSLQKNIKYDAYDSGTGNVWDNGTLGNYYGDFACEDKDGNGICDSPCGIPGGAGLDRYPLASFARSPEPPQRGEFQPTAR